MPRAYCPKCGAEVPVDDEGRCHVGHEVDLAAATGNQDLASAARALEAEFEEQSPPATQQPSDQHPDEPEPWVGDLEAAPPAETPPVGYHGPGGVGRDADDDLPPSARPDATPADETEAWQPPTAHPVGPGPQPPPVPTAAGEDDLDDDFDLDDLEAAVAELEVEERSDVAPPAAPPPPAAPAPEPESGTEEPDDEAQEEPADDDSQDESRSAEVDLSNFTASGDKVGGNGKKRGLFGFGR